MNPFSTSFSLISSSDFRPKLRSASSSSSRFCKSWPTVWMSFALRQLKARTERSSSSIGVSLRRPGLALALVALGRHVAAAALDVELHPQVALVGDGGDVEVAVDDLDVARGLDVGGVDLGRAANVEDQRDGVLGEALEVQLLQVEDDLGHVLLDMGDRGEPVR